MAVRDPRTNAVIHTPGEFTKLVESLMPPEDPSLLPEIANVAEEEETFTPLALRAIEMTKIARERAEKSPSIEQTDIISSRRFKFDPSAGISVEGTEVVLGDRSIFVPHRNFNDAHIECEISRAEELLRNGGGTPLH